MQRRAATRVRREEARIAGAVLAWYDRERRRLPWRAEHGEAPDPYRVWLSEIMLQQTTVKAVLPRYDLFLRALARRGGLARAELGEVLAAWAGLGYYARARNLHACARAVAERHGGKFPGRRGRNSASCRASATIPPPPSRPSPSASARRRSTAISSAWWRGFSP